MKTNRRDLLKLLAAIPFVAAALQAFGKAESDWPVELPPPDIDITPVGPRTVSLPVAAHPDAGKCYLLQNTFWLDAAEHFQPNDVVQLIELHRGIFVSGVFIEIIKPNRAPLLVNVGCKDDQDFYSREIDLGAPADTLYDMQPSSLYSLVGGRVVLEKEMIEVTFLGQPAELAFKIAAVCMQF